MGEISSINFKKSNAIQTMHNDRVLPPSYLIGGNTECNRNSAEALKLKDKIISEAKEKYTEHTKQKFQAKSYEWSAVVNLKPESTMQDLEKLAEHFFKKYGFQCYQIAIHRDEGHINEQGEKIINHHAHLEFITLDKNTGKNNYRRELITPKILRQIQSEVAEILQMKRGIDKRISGAKRIEPRKYAQMKEKEKINIREFQKENDNLKTEILSLKEIKERLEQERKAWILEKTHTAEEYKQLRALKDSQYKTIQELELKIQELNEALKYEKSKLRAFSSDLKAIKQKDEVLYSQTNSNALEVNFEPLNDIKQNKTQKEQIDEQEIIDLERDITFIQNQEYNQTKTSLEAILSIIRKYEKFLDKTEINNYQKQDYLHYKDNLTNDLRNSPNFLSLTADIKQTFLICLESVKKYFQTLEIIPLAKVLTKESKDLKKETNNIPNTQLIKKVNPELQRQKEATIKQIESCNTTQELREFIINLANRLRLANIKRQQEQNKPKEQEKKNLGISR